MKSITFLCLALIVKYISKTMDVMDQLLVTKVNYKRNSYLDNYLQKLLCQACCFNFFSSQNSFFVKHIKFEKRKILKKYKWGISPNSVEDENSCMVKFLRFRRLEKRNRTDFYWRVIKVCVGSIQRGGIETFCLLSSKFIKILNYIKPLCIIFMLIWFTYFDQICFNTLRPKYVQGVNCFNTLCRILTISKVSLLELLEKMQEYNFFHEFTDLQKIIRV